MPDKIQRKHCNVRGLLEYNGTKHELMAVIVNFLEAGSSVNVKHQKPNKFAKAHCSWSQMVKVTKWTDRPK
jgi:hypothetical protein